MWTTVLLLALAVNLEPTRIGLVPLLLSRRRPILQLLAFFVCGFTTTLGFGLLVLFVFHRNPFGTAGGDGAKVQIAVGAVALLVAATMAVHALQSRRRPARTVSQSPSPAETAEKPSAAEKFAERVRRVLAKGGSPWIAGLVGVSTGLPSPDYLAMLVVIATAKVPPAEQAAALVVFNIIGSLVVIIPLAGYLLAPARTLDLVERFGAWTRSRSRIEYAALLALAGTLLIGLGWTHLR